MKVLLTYLAISAAIVLLHTTFFVSEPVRAERSQLSEEQLEAVLAVAIAKAPEIANNPRIAKSDIAEQWDDGMSGIFRDWFGPTRMMPNRKTWIEFTCLLDGGVWECDQFRYQRILSSKERGDLWIENEVTYDEAIGLLQYLESRTVKAEPSDTELTMQEHRDIDHIFSCGETICVVTRSEYGIPIQFKVRRTRVSSGESAYELLALEWR